MDDGVVGSVNARERAVAQLVGQSTQRRNFEVGLDLVERVAVIGCADTKTVVAKSCKASGQGSVNVGVVVVLE